MNKIKTRITAAAEAGCEDQGERDSVNEEKLKTKKIDLDWKRIRGNCGWMLKENASVDIIRSADAIENSIRRKRLLANKDVFASKYAGSEKNREICFTCVDEYIHDGKASIEASERFSKCTSRANQHGIFSALEMAAIGGDCK